MSDQWYLECVNPAKNEHKFYEVTVLNTGNSYSVSTRHGRIGQKGRTLVVKAGVDKDTALAMANSIVEGKTDKGYKKVKSSKSNAAQQKPDDEPNRFCRLNLD